MSDFNSVQETKRLNKQLSSPPENGGPMVTKRFTFTAPVGGVAIAETIAFGLIPPGYRFNPSDAKIHWDVGTATCDLDLGHAGFSTIDDAGVLTDVAADPNEFLVAADLGAANLAGSALLNARVGGIKPSPKTVAKLPLEGLIIEGTIATIAMLAGQTIVLEIPCFKA